MNGLWRLAAVLGLLVAGAVAFGVLMHDSSPASSAAPARHHRDFTVTVTHHETAVGPEQRAWETRLGECEIAISWSQAQRRRERACEAEVSANFRRGDWSPPALRAGRFH